MEEQGKIISSCDVDENLALQMWTRGKTPRLSVFNKNKNQRKLISIAWVEKRDRTLSINGKNKGENVSYTVQDFEPAIQKILAAFSVNTNFKVKFFTVVVDLEKALHHPEFVSGASEFSLMSEDKRSSMWINDGSSDKDKYPFGIFRPFFPVKDSEADLMIPEKLRVTSQAARGIEGLMNTGIPAALKKANPERWHNVIRVTAAAMLLGFSYCGGEGIKMSDYLWSAGEKQKAPGNLPGMKIPVKKLSLHDPELLKLGYKLAAYVRHYYYIDDIDINYVGDSEKDAQERGFTKSRRVDFSTGTLGDVPYRVTFFENETMGLTAFGCSPRMNTTKHTGDMMITIPTESYKAALHNDTMGGPEDDFFTLTRLLWAKQFKTWYENIKPYVKSFAGLVN